VYNIEIRHIIHFDVSANKTLTKREHDDNTTYPMQRTPNECDADRWSTMLQYDCARSSRPMDVAKLYSATHEHPTRALLFHLHTNEYCSTMNVNIRVTHHHSQPCSHLRTMSPLQQDCHVTSHQHKVVAVDHPTYVRCDHMNLKPIYTNVLR
jgi:hypothetical protein